MKKPVSFWSTLAKKGKPIFVIAPMANVTDYAFRSMCAKYGKPDVMWNEFVSADGLCSLGRERLLLDLAFSKKERPIVAQLFTGNPEKMREATVYIRELGFDGIDINMGCPDRAVEKQGSGAAHIRNPKRALEVIHAAREGWVGTQGDLSNPIAIPVSVKTRIGYNKDEIDTWIRLLLSQQLPALTVHLRTRKEMSDVPAHWDVMPRIVALRDEISPETLIIGNGDVESLEEAAEKVRTYGCDGVMIGRGVFGKPWFFERDKKKRASYDSSPQTRLDIMCEHTKLFEKTYCGDIHAKNFAVMKKHFKAYVSGWDGAKELRAQLMETNSYKEVRAIVIDFMKSQK